MLLKNKKNHTIIYASLALVFTIPLVLKTNHNIRIAYNKKELFNQNLNTINSIPKAINFINYRTGSKDGIPFDTINYVNEASNFVKQRFVFGLSRYSYLDNWIACLCNDVAWDHFSAIVNPNDIIKHNQGICSQQTIVFLEILKKKNINTRHVGLGNQVTGPGHFLCEVNYNNGWHIYDVTTEPNWFKLSNHHNSIDYYAKNLDSLYLLYSHRYEKKMISSLFTKVSYGALNEFPAKKMLIFHQITLILTYVIPLFFLFMAYMNYKITNKEKWHIS